MPYTLLNSDSDFERGASEGTWIRHLPLSARWKSELVNSNKLRCLGDYRVIILLEDRFVMSILPKYEFYMLDLR